MKYIIAVSVFLFVVSGSPVFAEELTVVEGVITSMGADHILMDNNKYFIVTDEMADEDPSLIETQCWVVNDYQQPIDFNTILGVGYVDMARVTLKVNVVRKIEIIELLQ